MVLHKLCITHGCNSSGFDIVLGTFTGKSLGKADKTHLGSAIIPLTEISLEWPSAFLFGYISGCRHTIETSSASSIDHAPKLLFTEDRPSSFRTCESTFEMDLNNLVPLLVWHVLEPDTKFSFDVWVRIKYTHPLSRKIPALFIRIVTAPKLSTAVLMTAAPSETDEVFTTAFPPTKSNVIGIGHDQHQWR